VQLVKLGGRQRLLLAVLSLLSLLISWVHRWHAERVSAIPSTGPADDAHVLALGHPVWLLLLRL
jgi:hypothetical protein